MVFKCTLCTKSFKSPGGLVLHTNLHNKKYQCKHCGKYCQTLYILQIHERRHTGEMPFSCPDCSECFQFKKNLNRHRCDDKGTTSEGTVDLIAKGEELLSKLWTAVEKEEQPSQIPKEEVEDPDLEPERLQEAPEQVLFLVKEEFPSARNCNPIELQSQVFRKPDPEETENFEPPRDSLAEEPPAKKARLEENFQEKMVRLMEELQGEIKQLREENQNLVKTQLEMKEMVEEKLGQKMSRFSRRIRPNNWETDSTVSESNEQPPRKRVRRKKRLPKKNTEKTEQLTERAFITPEDFKLKSKCAWCWGSDHSSDDCR